MKKKWYIMIVLFIVIGILGLKWNEGQQIKNCGNEIKSNIEKIGNDGKAEIELALLIPFEWDEAYIFKPYIDKKSIREIIKCSPKVYRSSVSESDSQIYFIKGNKVVASINGNYENLGFYIDYDFDNYYYKLDATSVIEIEMINGCKRIRVKQ